MSAHIALPIERTAHASPEREQNEQELAKTSERLEYGTHQTSQLFSIVRVSPRLVVEGTAHDGRTKLQPKFVSGFWVQITPRGLSRHPPSG
jgi:hypothetical protein